QLRTEVLAEWIRLDEMLELRNERRMFAERQIRVEPSFECGESRLGEPGDVGPEELDIAEIRQCIATPEIECTSEEHPSLRDIARGNCAATTPHELIEGEGVDGRRLDGDDVAVTASLQGVGADELAKRRDVPLECVRRSIGRSFAPERIEEPINRD